MAIHISIIICPENKMNSLDLLDTLQSNAIEEAKKKKKEAEKKYHFDRLKMYFGEEYKIKDIIITQPKIGDILEIGEENFYHALSPILYNSTSIRVMLWRKLNLDWNNVRDIEVFSIMSQIIQNKEPLKLIFKNISFEDFRLIPLSSKEASSSEELGLFSPSQNILLLEDDYMEIAEYIREFMNFHPKREKVKGRTAVSWVIQEDEMNAVMNKETESSTLLPLVSTCVNHSGFKYKLHELKDLHIFEFMDAVQRIQVYESSIALLRGSYSGFCDSSKIPKENFNFARNIYN